MLPAHEQVFREGRPPASTPGGLAPDYSTGDAHQIVARNHEFDIEAPAAVYGGGWTTVGLVATSLTPVVSGVLIPLLDVLLEHGASVDATDATWGGTPLQWAFFGLVNSKTPPVDPERYYAVMSRLVDAGATIKPEWLDNARERGDRKLLAVLRQG
jgi:hypothetical protein